MFSHMLSFCNHKHDCKVRAKNGKPLTGCENLKFVVAALKLFASRKSVRVAINVYFYMLYEYEL